MTKSAPHSPAQEALVPFVIEQNNVTGAVSYWQGGGNQSVADSQGVSLAEYIHLLYGFLRQAKAAHVLMIGCGGGTLATMLDRAGVRVTIVDVSAASFEIAWAYFHMPETIETWVEDGRAFLAKHETRYDAIVLDAFDGQTIPAQLQTPAFFALAKSRLKRGGVFLANLLVADDEDRTPDRFAKRMRQVWRNVRLLDRPEWENRNTIAMAGSVKNFKRPRLLMQPKRRAKSLAAALKTMQFRDIRA